MARKKKQNQESLQWPDGRIPVAIYARVSSDAQDVENSIDAQLNKCREWAERNGYVVVQEFVDRAKSGRADKRPDFREMIDVAESPDCQFAMVLVWRFSRFFRNKDESAFYKQRLRKSGVRVISVNEPVDDSSVGRLTEGMFELMDGFQSELISEEVKRGTHNLARRGFFLGRVAPYGMMKVKVPDGKKERNKLAPDPRTAPHVRRMFDLALEDRTEGQITKTLNAEGIPSASGGPWKANRVHESLTNRHHEGTIVWAIGSDDPVIAPNSHPGIVTPEEFEIVQQKLKGRAFEIVNPRTSGNQHLLSELVKCRQCGSSVTYATGGKKGKTYHYLLCSNRKDNGLEGCDSPWLPAEEFEALVMAEILDDLLTPEHNRNLIEELRAESGEAITKARKRAEDIEKRLREIDQRQDRLLVAYELGKVELPRYSAHNEDLEEMRKRTEAERDNAMSAMDEHDVILENPGDVVEYTKELASFLRSEETGRCRPWLKTFLRCIWIEPGRGSLQYRIPLPTGGRFPGQTRRSFELGEKVRRSTRSAPHGRGCSAHGRVQGLVAEVGPARAGVFLRILSARCRRQGGPRTGGGVPQPLRTIPVPPPWAPHGRGCSVEIGPLPGVEFVGPARAGVFPLTSGFEFPLGGGPRTGGGVPHRRRVFGFRRGWAPHGRGCSLSCMRPRRRGFVGPARAGVFPNP